MTTETRPTLIKTKYQVKAQKTVGFFDDGSVRHIDGNCTKPMSPFGYADSGSRRYFCPSCRTIFVDSEEHSESVKNSRQNRIDFLKGLKKQGKSYADLARAEGKNYHTTFVFCRKYNI